jgi:isopentenyl-diphosphate delta-isomerase
VVLVSVHPFRPSRRRPGAGTSRVRHADSAHWGSRGTAGGLIEHLGVVMPLHRPAPPEPAGAGELIVLVNEAGEPIGTAPKLASHHRDTPLHLAFSSYIFDHHGRFLLTQRAHTKKTWPGTWTNSCCGHPGPGEAIEDAVRRRLGNELNLQVGELIPLLPDFRYWAELDGVVENEICPVFGAVTDAEPEPNPDEVAQIRWVEWTDVVAGRLDVPLSPWCLLQLEQLAEVPALKTLL